MAKKQDISVVGLRLTGEVMQRIDAAREKFSQRNGYPIARPDAIRALIACGLRVWPGDGRRKEGR